ncbi:MAG: SpoIVB peptidase [Bacilli bacterium]|nr:SpoIVB peptidase [Bacilli bacterium]
MRNKLLVLFISFFLSISSVLAYSNQVILGGDNIGIEVKTDGVLVIGLYKVNNDLIAKSSGIEVGDYIVRVNDHNVKTIEDFVNEIDLDSDKEELDIEYKRDSNINKTVLKLELENNEYKTGLYVKDTVNGIGTLTMIDPKNNKFLALGHQIQDSSTKKILDIESGSIYESYITGISKSIDGTPGEKEATTNMNERYGSITDNTDKGIYGYYEKEIDKTNLITIADPDEIELGRASILTVIDQDTVKEYSINIDKIDKKDDLKNIMFTITDEELLSKTGGIVQGMSGSPIVQNNKLVGAVTHVIVDDCEKGYGIFITKMLEESEER